MYSREVAAMKIKCVNCGRLFDQDRFSDICPACNTYNKRADNYWGRELTPEEQAEYDAKYNREPMSYDLYPKDVIDVDRIAPVWLKKTEAYKENPKIKYVWAGVACAVFIILVIIGIVGF